MRRKSKKIPLMLRLPPVLHKRIVWPARRNNRSLNAEVVAKVEGMYKRYDQERETLNLIEQVAVRTVAEVLHHARVFRKDKIWLRNQTKTT